MREQPYDWDYDGAGNVILAELQEAGDPYGNLLYIVILDGNWGAEAMAAFLFARLSDGAHNGG